MVPVRTGLAAILGALALLLAGLAAGSGSGAIGALGVVVALTTGAVLAGLVAHTAASRGLRALGPADLVTLTRAAVACAVAGQVTEAYAGSAPSGDVLVWLAGTALVLDAVDGRVARSTGTATAFGARLDGEADAFLMLVLSVHVAGSYGAWVLAIGTYRYLFGAAGWVLPWMRAELSARYWRKVVAAVAGIALVLAAADDATGPLAEAGLAAALLLLTESFGRDVVWLWRHRHRAAASTVPASWVTVA